MEQHIDEVMCPGVQPKDLTDGHVRKPGERHPIARLTRGESPMNVLPGKTLPNKLVGRHTIIVIKGSETTVQGRQIHCQREQGQKQGNETGAGHEKGLSHAREFDPETNKKTPAGEPAGFMKLKLSFSTDYLRRRNRSSEAPPRAARAIVLGSGTPTTSFRIKALSNTSCRSTTTTPDIYSRQTTRTTTSKAGADCGHTEEATSSQVAGTNCIRNSSPVGTIGSAPANNNDRTGVIKGNPVERSKGVAVEGSSRREPTSADTCSIDTRNTCISPQTKVHSIAVRSDWPKRPTRCWH